MIKFTSTLIPLLLLLSAFVPAQAQDKEETHKYWVYLSDKSGSKFNPYEYFDAKAIARRQKLGISLYDSSDFPVSASYLDQISLKVDSIKVVSRWFNALFVNATPDQIEDIAKLHFVKDIEPAKKIEVHAAFNRSKNTKQMGFDLSDEEKNMAQAQLERMNGSAFKVEGYTGKGIRIAILDAGFRSYKTNPAFQHLRDKGQILKTWDFVKGKDHVDGFDNHGTNVLCCIAGKDKDQEFGLAQDAEFLLARTETWTEFFAEEENWLAAAEWADKNGADIINSSLGYTYHRYFRYNMDGKTAMVSRAANMAARKGILVVNSAGNEGSDAWKNVGAPADADSVLSVGGINPGTGIHTSFSSFGPTWDKRLKPNVCAYGHVVAAGPKGYHETQGTSFSSPLVAGFAACAWQTDTTMTNMQLFNKMQQAGDLFPYFDYAHGYGVPQASHFVVHSIPYREPLIEIVEDGPLVRIKLLDTIQFDSIETKGNSIRFPGYVFYHIQNRDGYLDKYFVVDPNKGGYEMPNGAKVEPHELVIDKRSYTLPFMVRATYMGSYDEHIVGETPKMKRSK